VPTEILSSGNNRRYSWLEQLYYWLGECLMLGENTKKLIVNYEDNGLLSTPPLPENFQEIILTDNAEQVLLRRYVRRGKKGESVESVEEMFWRVAYHIASVEKTWDNDIINQAEKFYKLLTGKYFFPNSPTFTGAGTSLGQLAACFVLPITDDMGGDSAGIFQTLRNAALIQQTGGGNGFSFSRLRPKHTLVKTSAGQATGPVGFLRVYDKAFGEIAQGGTRRGANMAVLRIDHPDIEDFITCKIDENAITNFNISVGVTDAFMEAVEHDDWWELRFPDVSTDAYRNFNGTLEDAEAAGIPIRVHKRIRARELFDKIVQQAHHNGEPGMLFLDTANLSNPLPNLYKLEATNPCGEQWLGPYENCCLGSINLAQHIGPNNCVDWETLQDSVVTATRFLDDVVQANAYVPTVPQLMESAFNARRIGLGIMGLGDLMYHVGIRYGSDEGQEFAAQVIEFVRYHAMLTSVDLARERGPFPVIDRSVYYPRDMKWQPPKPLVPYTQDWGRPKIDWGQVVDGIREFGIRNAAQTTVAPTGTIATVAGCEGYGCEPVFALAYVRHVNDNGKDLQLDYISPLFFDALEQEGINNEARESIIDHIMEQGSAQNLPKLPDHIRQVFVVSQDISAEEHVRMQASMQAFVDNSLSKTINFPADASEEDVAKAYKLAWKLGCKGITVYITGSRQNVVLETKATSQNKLKSNSGAETELSDDIQTVTFYDNKKPRPTKLAGYTYIIKTPVGKAFVTINENGGNLPFEVFISTAKAGSETAAVSEAIGRMISYVLRLASPISPRERLKEIVRQLSGIGGSRSLGFGPNRVRSLPDGVAQALAEYLLDTAINDADKSDVYTNNNRYPSPMNMDEEIHFLEESNKKQPSLTIGDLCPECGHAAVVNEEGCRKCYACGFSEC
jgi:ribonucleoside-diphosphate reductase alpha chain